MKAVTKDPSDVLDYTFNLLRQMALDVDTVASGWVTAPSGITKDSESTTTTGVTAWISGGTHGVDYPVVYRAATTGGRTYERTIVVRVRNL